MRRLLLLLLIVVPLIAAPSAGAKGLKWVELCGPADCNRTPWDQIAADGLALTFPPWGMSGRPDDPPEQAAPWLRVRVAVDHSEKRMRSLVLPDAGYAGGNQGGGFGYVWQRLDRDEQGSYARLAHGLRMYPAATMPGLSTGLSRDGCSRCHQSGDNGSHNGFPAYGVTVGRSHRSGEPSNPL